MPCARSDKVMSVPRREIGPEDSWRCHDCGATLRVRVQPCAGHWTITVPPHHEPPSTKKPSTPEEDAIWWAGILKQFGGKDER